MKTSIKAIVLLLAISLAYVTCKKLDPNDGITFEVNTDVYKSPVLITFVNANPTSTNQPLAETSIKITGKDAQYVIMNDGGSSISASQGILQLNLNNRTPSATNPVEFVIEASFPGYAPVYKSFHLTDTTEKAYSVYVQELANPAPGTSITKGTLTPNAESSISTPTSSEMTESTKLTMQAGTILKDADGNTITASTVDASLIHFGTGNEAAYNAFPGGLQTRSAFDKNGQKLGDANGVLDFITAGCLQINMNAGGKAVKSFSKPIIAEMEISSSYYNYFADRLIQEGDQIPLWSMDEGTGKWILEGDAIVSKKANGKLYCKFEIAHLSNWNLDGWRHLAGRYGMTQRSCGSKNFTVNVQTENNVKYNGWITLTMYDSYGNYMCSNWGSDYMSNGKLTTSFNTAGLVYIPFAKIIASTYAYGQYIQQTTETFSPCSQNSTTITIKTPQPPDYVNVSVNIKGKCTTKNLALNYSGWVYMRDNSASDYWSGFSFLYLSSYSKNTFYNLKNNGSYTFWIWKGRWYEKTVTLRKTDELNWGASTSAGSVKASSKYNAATNTIEVSGSFEANCN